MEIRSATSPASAAPTQPASGRRNVREVALKFEALLVTQMFNAMQNTVEKSGLMDGGSAEDTYREMLNQALSGELARRGGLGLAEHIEREIENKIRRQESGVGGRELKTSSTHNSLPAAFNHE